MNHPALEALTRRSHTAGALTLRPLTLGSYSLCCRANLRIVLGPEIDADGKPKPASHKDQPFEVAAFAYIHSAPQDQVLDALDAGEKHFRRTVDAWALDLSLADFAALTRILPDIIKDAFSALVVPVAKSESSDDFDSKNAPGRRE